MSQLPIFSAEADAERTLQEALDHLQAAYRTLDDQYEALWLERRTWRQERETLQRERDLAARQAQYWQRLFEMSGAMPRTPARPAPALAPILKSLLSLAHPDKWSQGQPATALAHELAVAITDARAHLEGQP